LLFAAKAMRIGKNNALSFRP